MMKGFEISNENCRAVIDSLPMSILIIDNRGIVTYTNRAFEKLFGKGYIKNLEKRPGDLLSCQNSFLAEEGCSFSEACQKCILRNYIQNTISGKERPESTEVFLTLMGDYEAETKWFEVHMQPTCGEKENQYLISLLDISYYKKNNYQLLEHKKAADSANRAKSEFLANMSHEIRTPLNGVIGMLELTLLTNLDEEQRENLEVAKNCADTLLNLINDVLDLSKVESNRVVLEEVQFDMRDLVRKVADIQTAKVLEKGLELACIVDEKLPDYFYGDAFRIQQVLNNLLSNAVKFTEKGTIQLEVKKLCGSHDSCTIVFSVEDSGIGIAQKDITRLFKPFIQVDGSISRKYGGTGLGLAISQKLVQLMGGEIKVKSVQEKGSVFFFTIQIKVTDAKDKEKAETAVDETVLSSAKILIVEDDRANQIVIKQMLQKLGYHDIKIASNGFEGIKFLEEALYDVVLMDIQLPEMDGIDTTHIIRAKEKGTGSHVPIVALTAHALKGDKEKFMQEGMDAYVAKPVNVKSLGEALQSMLDKGVKGEQKGQKEPDVPKEEELKQAYASWSPSTEEKGSHKILTSSDRRAFRTLMNEIGELAEQKEKTGDTYIQMEKKIHELKIRAQRKEYEEIKSTAFRIELAARKKDDEKIKKLYELLKTQIEKH